MMEEATDEQARLDGEMDKLREELAAEQASLTETNEELVQEAKRQAASLKLEAENLKQELAEACQVEVSALVSSMQLEIRQAKAEQRRQLAQRT